VSVDLLAILERVEWLRQIRLTFLEIIKDSCSVEHLELWTFLVLTLMTVQLQERMTVTPCRVQMEMSRLPEDLSDMQILQECRIVQQVTRRTRKLD